MYKKILVLLVLFYATVNAQQLISPQKALNQTDKTFFIENKGQWEPEVKYLARIGGINAWITNSGVVDDYYKVNRNFDETKTLKMNPQQKRDYENKNTSIQGHVVKMELINSEKEVTQVGNNQEEGYYNYFIGNDQSKWASNVPLYNNVELKGVYKNIDVKYYNDNGMLRYDYKAKPGADISRIKFKFEGQNGISINSNGELVLKTSIGEVTHGKIFAYQMDGGTQKEVECKFEQKEDGTVGIKADGYDATKELVIDPLVYSTFIGGNNWDCGESIALDMSGNAYITGYTESSNYPTTTGGYQISYGGGYSDAFITKLNSRGSGLIYSTFVGGSGTDQGNSIAIDVSGNAYITGYTLSSNYPTTTIAFQKTNGSTYNGNAFVTKINPTGSVLVYSTYIGGSGSGDQGNSIAIDVSGNAYITGNTSSANFPITIGSYQNTYGGGRVNAFITKLNSTGSALIYSTYIGGNKTDEANSIALDASGNAYITGATNSSNYPVTPGAYMTTLGGVNDFNAFITKLNSIGSALVYSTFIGGSDNTYPGEGDDGHSIAIDLSGNAYITGFTESSNYPTTSGAYQTTLGSSYGNAFVTKLNSSGGALLYSTYIGGNNSDAGTSIAIDASGNAYITGTTSSSNYPITSGAYQTTGTGLFVTKLNPTGSALVYSTIIGSSSAGYSIAIDSSRIAYITGQTSSSIFPTTSGAYQTAFGGYYDAFVTKLNLSSTDFVKSNNSSFPTKFELMQNYPNPFNPTTTINYSVSKASLVIIKVYDILGREVTTLVNEEKNAGNYSVQFSGSKLTSGIYFYRMQSGSFVETKKLMLLK